MEFYVLIQDALRVLFLICFPMIIATVVLSTFFSTLMAATSVHEQSVSYAVRLVSIIIVFYVLFDNILKWFIDLARLSLG